MGTIMNRAQVKARLYELVRDDPRIDPRTSTVDYGTPPEGRTGRGIWFGRVAGPHSVPVMQASRKQRDDAFAITAWCWVADAGLTPQEAELEVQFLFGILEDHIADDPKLGGTVTDLLWVTVGEVILDSGPQDEGYYAFCQAELNCRSRLT